MRSRALNMTFNRALVNPEYRQSLLYRLRRTLLEAGVPEDEIEQLERYAPDSLEGLASALEEIHVSSFSRQGRV